MSQQLTLKITDKRGTHQIKIDSSKTVGDLKSQLTALSNCLFYNLAKIPVIQQQLSETVNGKKSVYSDDSMPLKIAKINSDTQVHLKNLGPQIRWDYVFYIEYGGPLIIFPLLYLLGHRSDYNEIQLLALFMGLIHFAKR